MSCGFAENPFLLIGSNIRFLAENAVCHGHNIFTVDYYGDWDTRKLSPNRAVSRDGAAGDFSMMSLVDLAEGIDNCGVVFGPGFENDLKALLSLKKLGAPLGCGIDSIRNVRNPGTLARAASTWAFKYPDIQFNRPKVEGAKRWLVKPLDGIGGIGIGDAADSRLPTSGRVYYQRFAEGIPSSAAVVSDGSNAVVLGIMTQIIGEESFGASGFRFTGNVYPHPFSNEAAEAVTNIAEALTLEFDLRGLWGFDFIYDGSVTLIEVNPRPTAGMGLVGIATLNDLLGMHIDCVAGENCDRNILDSGSSSEYTAQARVFALRDCVFAGSEEWREKGARDIPENGDFIPAGSPVLTLIKSGTSYSSVLAKLRKEAEALQSRLTLKATASAK